MSRNAQQPTKLYVLEEALEVAPVQDTEDGLTAVNHQETLDVALTEDMEECLIDGNRLAMEVKEGGRGV